jgi:arylsulfatase A-like enzyme
VHWPARIKKPGLRHEPGHLIDVMATCVDIAGVKYPREFAGHRIQPLEGKTLEPVFRGKSLRERPLFFEHEANRAVRVGDWKLVSRHPGDWELDNLARDRAEQNNLVSHEPKRVAKLTALYEEWAKRADVPAAEFVASKPQARTNAPAVH